MHHPVFRINFLLHFVSIILIILLHSLFIAPMKAHLSRHHYYHHPFLPLFFTPDSKPTFSTNPPAIEPILHIGLSSRARECSTVFCFSFSSYLFNLIHKTKLAICQFLITL